MTVEIITANHVAIVSRWWVLRGEGVMPDGVLPPDGFVACDADGPLVAAWFYRPVGCQVGIVDWLVSRPGERPSYVRPAARAVFAAIERLAEKDGLTRIFASAARAGMIREAKDCGFHVAASGITHLVKCL